MAPTRGPNNSRAAPLVRALAWALGAWQWLPGPPCVLTSALVSLTVRQCSRRRLHVPLVLATTRHLAQHYHSTEKISAKFSVFFWGQRGWCAWWRREKVRSARLGLAGCPLQCRWRPPPFVVKRTTPRKCREALVAVAGRRPGLAFRDCFGVNKAIRSRYL